MAGIYGFIEVRAHGVRGGGGECNSACGGLSSGGIGSFMKAGKVYYSSSACFDYANQNKTLHCNNQR